MPLSYSLFVFYISSLAFDEYQINVKKLLLRSGKTCRESCARTVVAMLS